MAVYLRGGNVVVTSDNKVGTHVNCCACATQNYSGGLRMKVEEVTDDYLEEFDGGFYMSIEDTT